MMSRTSRLGRARAILVFVLVAFATAAPPRTAARLARSKSVPVSDEVAEQLYSDALYAPVCPEVRSAPKLALPQDAVQDGAEGPDGDGVRWMLLPDGRGEAQVAVLSGARPKQMPELTDIQFLLYTRDNRDRPERRAMNATCLPRFNSFSAERPTAVLVHGFADSAQESLMIPLLKDAFLERADHNVLVVDWSQHARSPWYQTAAQSTELVGGHLARLLDHLADTQGLRGARTHVVGFSLGAHVAGHAGKRVAKGALHKITGLDPARVLFERLGPEQRLGPNDADLVEVVHSSGGYLGFSEPLGHRDFYPNGGEWPQPGCLFDFISVCSHRRAYYYYAEALKDSNSFPAYPCASLEEFRKGLCKKVAGAHLGDDNNQCMGDACPHGNFYFETNPSSPFAKPQEDLLDS